MWGLVWKSTSRSTSCLGGSQTSPYIRASATCFGLKTLKAFLYIQLFVQQTSVKRPTWSNFLHLLSLPSLRFGITTFSFCSPSFSLPVAGCLSGPLPWRPSQVLFSHFQLSPFSDFLASQGFP